MSLHLNTPFSIQDRHSFHDIAENGRKALQDAGASMQRRLLLTRLRLANCNTRFFCLMTLLLSAMAFKYAGLIEAIPRFKNRRRASGTPRTHFQISPCKWEDLKLREIACESFSLCVDEDCFRGALQTDLQISFRCSPVVTLPRTTATYSPKLLAS